MSTLRRLHFRCVTPLASVALAAGIAGHPNCAADPAADAARSRAEIEQKGRELKKKAELQRREVEARQREVRARLNLPNPAGTKPGTSATKPGQASAPGARKDRRLPELPASARGPAGNAVKNRPAYSPKRGQDFAFQVEMSTNDDGIQKQWIGTPYFAGVYSEARSSSAEMFCIGTLSCRIRPSNDRPWSRVDIEDIELPQQFLLGSHGVLNAETASHVYQHTLPLQLSAILPLEELIFPGLPLFSERSRNESRSKATYYLRGGQKSFFGVAGFTTLNGEETRLRRIENDNSSALRIVSERTFHCPSQGICLSFQQKGTFDAREGMILDSDLDYLLELGERARLTAKVRRLHGNDLATVRAAALKSLPPENWPAYFRRIPADDDQFDLHIPRSPAEVPAGQRVSASIEINAKNAHGFRCYLARTIGTTQEGNVRIRLDGSNEELDVSHVSLRLPR